MNDRFKLLFIILLLVGIWLAPSVVEGDLEFGISATAGTTSDPSMNAASARLLGLGRAVTALNGDVSTIFSNPAGLTGIRDLELTATSTTLLNDITDNFAAGAYKTQWGTFGLGFSGLSTGASLATMRDPSNAGRIIINPSVEAMSYTNSAFILSYARKLYYMGDVSLGVNMKMFNQYISGSSDASSRGSGLDFDLGAQYIPEQYPWLTAGLTLQNALSSSVKWSGASSASDSLPANIKLGAYGKLLGKDSCFDEYYGQEVYGAFDLELPRKSLAASGSMLMRMGVEWKPVSNVSVRMGYDQNPASTNINYGIGLERGGFRFDYAYKGAPVSDAVSNVFTLSYAPEPEKPKPMVKKAPYKLDIKYPADKSVTSAESVWVKGFIENAFNLSSVIMNGKPVMPLVTASSFEAYWTPVNEGPNIISIEASVTSPEAGTVYAELKLFRTKPIKDVRENYFAKEPITYMTRLNLMPKFNDGTFKPGKTITRGDLVTVLVKAGGISAEAVKRTGFKDLKPKDPLARYVMAAVKKKYISGYSNKTFRASKSVTRAEAATIITKFAGMSFSTPESEPYIDIKKDNWAARYIIAAKSSGMLGYVATASFESNRAVNRGELAYMMAKTPQVATSIEGLFKPISIKAPMTPEVIQSLPVSDEARTAYNSVVVEGRLMTSEVKEIRINSKKIKLPKTGDIFSITLPLVTGQNSFEVKALGDKDKELYMLKRKLYR